MFNTLSISFCFSFISVFFFLSYYFVVFLLCYYLIFLFFLFSFSLCNFSPDSCCFTFLSLFVYSCFIILYYAILYYVILYYYIMYFSPVFFSLSCLSLCFSFIDSYSLSCFLPVCIFHLCFVRCFLWGATAMSFSVEEGHKIWHPSYMNKDTLMCATLYREQTWWIKQNSAGSCNMSRRISLFRYVVSHNIAPAKRLWS